ncbi:MAG: ribose 1,5-bisphosphate isomerase [Candidatus Altiarchaeales archaeon]|nr:ribose 1,5-bisphosphate isomerase [Candidatus Altiarchaeota archaeon]MBU4437611.1 ribose 1,5-bisphosphate isomerase [Candidatus Altiarchaeota archaeon]MCG2782142.1 ribose 1,5-bisphosphate isomerase [Candidatus Altiarchaeales archaeon]
MTADKTAKDIRNMRIRGALDIAIAAARAMRKELDGKSTAAVISNLKKSGKKLKAARPTAVSLPNAVDYVLYLAEKNKKLDAGEFTRTTSKDIQKFIDDQERALERIAEIGANLIDSNDTILTHCNSDTVVALFERARKEGKKFKVICTETRPRFQGHLTARALAKAKIPTTLVVDSAARLMMKEFKVDKVIVGGDTVLANGDLINKIGTSQIAVAARDLDIDFIAAVESIKFSPRSIEGEMAKIEYRDTKEVIKPGKIRGIKVLNPAFDITPAEMIDMLITEEGIIPPQGAYHLLREKFGWELSSF